MISQTELLVCKGEIAITIETATDDKDVLSLYGLQRKADGIIGWHADSKDHPRNWTSTRKTFDTTIIILLEFYTTVISTTGVAAAEAAGIELGLGKTEAIVIFAFLYQLGQAIGGYLIPPFSELIGRRLPYLASSLAFSLFCLIIAATDSPVAVGIGRFVTGFASAVPSVVIAGSVEDVFNEKQRVWIVVLWNAGTTVGLTMGPIYAAYIIAALGWKWVFYSAGAVTFGLFLAMIAVRESRPSLLLGSLVQRLREEHPFVGELEWDNPDAFPDGRSIVSIVIVRPMRILLTEPIVIMIAVISGVSWGIIYLFTEAMTKIYQSVGLNKEQSSLPFLAIAVGVLFTFIPRIWDQKVVRRRHRQKEEVEPEDKITGFAFAAPALTLGLAWFAWTVPPFATNMHWIIPTLGLIPVGFAVNEIAYTLSGYLADAYLLYSASAFSGLAFVRALLSGLMPIVSHAMYGGLGANIAGSVLVGISALFCVAPWVFLRYSKKLRERSPFARHSLDTHRRTQVEQ